MNTDTSPDENALLGNTAESSSHAKKSTPGDPDRRADSADFAQLDSDDKETFKAPRDQSIKRRFKLLNTAARLLPEEKISQCQRSIAPMKELVIGRYNPERESASFANVIRCESAACPVCSFMRSDDDRRKLTIALAAADRRGLFPLMATFTLRHHLRDSLVDLRAALAKAFDRMFSGRWYANLKDQWGIKGKVKTWEITYGLNGFHPHLHVLLFLDVELSGKWLKAFEDELKAAWVGALESCGRDASWEHGLNVKTADSAVADYIAKWGHEPIDPQWGVEHEIALNPVKTAHLDGFTMFELLAVAAEHDEPLARFCDMFQCEPEPARGRAGALYVEYFYAFKGRARLHWGKDLWAALEMDQEIDSFEAQLPTGAQSLDVWVSPRLTWYSVWKLRRAAALLARTRRGDPYELREWLKSQGLSEISVLETALRWFDDHQRQPPESDNRYQSAPGDPDEQQLPESDNRYQSAPPSTPFDSSILSALE